MVQQWLSANWVLRTLSPFLHEDDALRLAIYAMEMHERPLWRFLLFDDAVRPPLRFSRLVDHAMAHACWHAILELRRMDVRGVRRRQPMNQTEENADVWRASRKYFENEGMRPTDGMQAVIWQHSLQPRGIVSAVLYAAAGHGHLEAVLWLHCVVAYDPHKAVECAAQHGHLRVVDWLLRHHKAAKRVTARVKIRYLLRLEEENKLGLIAWNVYLPRRRSFTSYCLSSTHGLLPKKRARSLKHRYPLMDWAAAQGNLELLEEFHKDEFATVTCTTDAMDQAAEHGHLEIVQWLHEHRSEGCTSAAMTMAASQGHLDVVQWLHAYRTEGCDSGAHVGAAGNGHLEVVRWLDIYYPTTRKGYGWNDPLAQAAFGGHFDVVRYYSDFHGLELTARALADAAGSGHFEIVRWIIDRVEARVVDVDYIVSRAACSGNLELMHWLVDERGLWGFDVVRRAAMHNRVEILAYLHSVATRRASITGVAATPVANYAFDLVYLAATGCFETVEWLLRNAADYVVPLMNMDDFQFVAAMERYYEENDDALGMLNEEKSHKRPYQWSLASNQPRDRLQSVLRRLILALPTSVCMRFPWLPLWAIQTRSFDVLKALATITHPHVFKTAHLRALMIYSGHAPIIQWYVQQAPHLMTTRVVQWAAKYKKLDFLRWLLVQVENERFPELRTSNCLRTMAWTGARFGHVDVLRFVQRWMVEKAMDVSACQRIWRDLTETCAMYGHWEALEWVSEFGTWDAKWNLLAEIAGHHGQLECFKWITRTKDVRITRRGLDKALGSGHLDVVEWILETQPAMFHEDDPLLHQVDAVRSRRAWA